MLRKLLDGVTMGDWEVYQAEIPLNDCGNERFPDGLPSLFETSVITEWEHGQAEAQLYVVGGISHSPYYGKSPVHHSMKLDDARFIAAARNLWPEICDVVEAAERIGDNIDYDSVDGDWVVEGHKVQEFHRALAALKEKADG